MAKMVCVPKNRGCKYSRVKVEVNVAFIMCVCHIIYFSVFIYW